VQEELSTFQGLRTLSRLWGCIKKWEQKESALLERFDVFLKTII
jgi:hypothetical protein